MADVNETLQDLVHRRLRELGSPGGARNRDGDAAPMSLRRAYQSVPDGPDGRPSVSYETLRQIHTGVHSGRISDLTAHALAVILKVNVNEIYEAAGQRKRLSSFILPDKASQLDERERKVVLSVIDAILEGGSARIEREREAADPTSPTYQPDVFDGLRAALDDPANPPGAEEN